MSNGLAAVHNAAGIERKSTTPQQLIESKAPEFAKLLGANMDPVRFARIAVSEVSRNPKVLEDVPGLLSCIAIAASLKLELGVLGQCYIVPYGGKNTFITGWMGHVDLVSRANKATVRTLAVREGDEFDADLGSKPRIHFKPDINGDDDRPLIATVAIGHIVGMDQYPQIEVWGYEKLRKHLNRMNRIGNKHYAMAGGSNLATSHSFEMYARKIPLLQVVKYLPKSVDWQKAAQLDYYADGGKQVLDYQTTKGLIEGGEVQSKEIDLAPKFSELGLSKGESETWLKNHPGSNDDQADWLDIEILERAGKM